MSLFLSRLEKDGIGDLLNRLPDVGSLFWTLQSRAARRAASPLFGGADTTTGWWHHAAEYLGDGAMAHALKPAKPLAAWLRASTMAIVRRPVEDWIGPEFRDHSAEIPVGHLETAHLAWGVAIVLDLAPDVFTEAEREEIAECLREKAITLCLRWLDQNTRLSNWRCILTAGVAVSSVVVGDEEARQRAQKEFLRCQDIFQPDGSYGESLQYGNYAAHAQMLTWESLVRHSPDLAESLTMEPYARMPRWQAASYFYNKPLSGWGAYPRSRSANFNDSAAIFRPSADLLLHISARNREKLPLEAGLARWLFDTLYLPCIDQPPSDRASFGFVNDFGFLTLPLLENAAEALSPEAAGVSLVAGFSCGDVVARDAWDGRTILAVHGAGSPLHSAGHLHGDLNSFILVHNRERLLADPGHSCYRSLLHEVEISTATHNTCTFEVPVPEQVAATSGPALQEELCRNLILRQSVQANRSFDPQTEILGPLIERGGRRVLLERNGELTVIASEAAALYGDPITEFTRFWFLCGPHALFIVDHLRSSVPVRTTWNWLLNNRDDQLDLKLIHPDRLVARRGDAGLKLFHLGGAAMQGPQHSFLHDAYHPLPNQLGEGRPGSGVLVRWTEKSASTWRAVVHALCVDARGPSARWHLRTGENFTALESPGATCSWKLETSPAADRFIISETVSGKHFVVSSGSNGWQLCSNT